MVSMALYSPPPTPPSFQMQSTLPRPTPLSSWHAWHHPPKPQAPLTPPMSAHLQPRSALPTILPPIAHFDRLPALNTIKHHEPMQLSSPPVDPLPLPSDPFSRVSDQFFRGKPELPANAPQLVDWLDFTRHRSAHFIAEKTCEMICYLWFSSPNPYPSPGPSSSPPRPLMNSANAHLQFLVSHPFIQFMQKLLETTQVSQSVIVLSLHYIYRLRERNCFTTAQAGSEFRIAVAALMMANKFLDDNTYTNKTWSEVSGIELTEINKMEREFLMGVDFGLYVDKSTYESWLNLLKGMVLAKERDSRNYKSRTSLRSGRAANPRYQRVSSRVMQPVPVRPHRARSTSPEHSFRNVNYERAALPPPINTYAIPQYSAPCSHLPKSTGKRSADAAFSPVTANFSAMPSKRPVCPSLHIPNSFRGMINSYSPVEGLQSFSKMSLASPCQPTPEPTPRTWTVSRSDVAPRTLVTAYDNTAATMSRPQNLYFYALSCSPVTDEEENRQRKSRLRCHQPPSPPLPRLQVPSMPMPLNIQSASTSPAHTNIYPPAPHTLPYFRDLFASRPGRPYDDGQRVTDGNLQGRGHLFDGSPVRLAPFANAGPPGYQFYSTAQGV